MVRNFKITVNDKPRSAFEREHPIEVRGINMDQVLGFTINEAERLVEGLNAAVAALRRRT